MPNSDKYQEIADMVISALDEGTVPWRKPWEGGFARPRSVATGDPYHGINTFMLSIQPYGSPWWLTYNRAQKLGGHVRKGESATPIWYWNFVEVENEREVEDEDGNITTEVVEETVPMVKRFTIFNVEQCDLPSGWREQAGVPEPTGDAKGVDPVESAEEIVTGMPNPPEIERQQESARAFYAPADDRVVVPAMDQFSKVNRYYGTLFHELGHATGHGSRLDRDELTSGAVRGSDDYSREELVAEMTASFLVADAGLEIDIEQSAAYIDSWRQKINESPYIVMSAAGRAEKAARYIHGEYEEEDS